MEEWGFVDERDLQNWKGGVVCMTCQHFTYGVDQHCNTMLGCNLGQKQLQQGEHLKKRCKLWVPTWRKWAEQQHCVTTDTNRGIIRGIEAVRCSAIFQLDCWLLP